MQAVYECDLITSINLEISIYFIEELFKTKYSYEIYKAIFPLLSQSHSCPNSC